MSQHEKREQDGLLEYFFNQPNLSSASFSILVESSQLEERDMKDRMQDTPIRRRFEGPATSRSKSFVPAQTIVIDNVRYSIS